MERELPGIESKDSKILTRPVDVFMAYQSLDGLREETLHQEGHSWGATLSLHSFQRSLEYVDLVGPCLVEQV